MLKKNKSEKKILNKTDEFAAIGCNSVDLKVTESTQQSYSWLLYYSYYSVLCSLSLSFCWKAKITLSTFPFLSSVTTKGTMRDLPQFWTVSYFRQIFLYDCGCCAIYTQHAPINHPAVIDRYTRRLAFLAEAKKKNCMIDSS